MKKTLLVFLLLTCLFSACSKDQVEPTKEELILGEWTYDHFNNEYYNESDELAHVRTGQFHNQIKLSFDKTTVSRTYPDQEPEAGPYFMLVSDGKNYIEVPYLGNRETYELVKFTEDEMHWVQLKYDFHYRGKHDIELAKKAVLTIVLKKK